MNKKISIKFFPIFLIALVTLGGCSLPFAEKEAIQKSEEKIIEEAPVEIRDSQIIGDTEQIRIVTSEEPPMNYYSDEGEFIGTNVDIVEEIKRYLDLDVEIEVMPWARSYLIAKENPNVAIFTASKTQERVDLGFSFVGPLITRKHILWARKGSNFNINSIQDVKDQDLRIGAMRGDWREKYFVDLGFDVEDSTNHEQGLRKLIEGSIDLWALSEMDAPLHARALGINAEEIEAAYVFREALSYIMLSKGTPEETVKEWEKAFEEIQGTDFFEKASEKWSSILGSEIGYTKDMGFFARR